MSESSPSHASFDALTADVEADRRSALHALHVLEYALAAPAPRRHRTWLHRVLIAIEALHTALLARFGTPNGPIRLLDEIALSHPCYLPRIKQLEQDLRDLTIAVASLHELIEAEPEIEIDPDDVRQRLGLLSKRFRQHQAQEADLVFEAIGRELDDA